MKLRIANSLLPLLALLGLATSAPAQSATPTTAPSPAELSHRATLARDSALTQAAAVRTDIESQLVAFKSAFGGVAGLRRRVIGYGLKSNNTSRVRMKTHVVKHKTSNVKVEKIEYFSREGKPLLRERYVQGQLVRLEVFKYTPTIITITVPSPRTVSANYMTDSWLFVQGDYLRRNRRIYGKRVKQTYYFLNRTRPTE